jgi:hypothetical protein
MNTLYALELKNPNHWRHAQEECARMRQWAFNPQAQADLCAKVELELGVPDWLVVRVHKRPYYVHPSILYPTLEAYIDATREVFIANVRAYQAEVAAFEAAHRKRRREALRAERAAAPPAPARAQPPRAFKRARICASFIKGDERASDAICVIIYDYIRIINICQTQRFCPL